MPGSLGTAFGCVLVGEFACRQHQALLMKLKGSLISGRLWGSQHQRVVACSGMNLCASSQARDRVPGTRTGYARELCPPLQSYQSRK